MARMRDQLTKLVALEALYGKSEQIFVYKAYILDQIAAFEEVESETKCRVLRILERG